MLHSLRLCDPTLFFFFVNILPRGPDLSDATLQGKRWNGKSVFTGSQSLIISYYSLRIVADPAGLGERCSRVLFIFTTIPFSRYVKDLSAPTDIFRESIILPRNYQFSGRSTTVCLKIYWYDFKYTFHFIIFNDLKSTFYDVRLHFRFWLV